MNQKLDPEFKKRWIAALRSGEYKQGRHALYHEATNSYCCLGVASHVCGNDNKAIMEDGYSKNMPETIARGVFNPIAEKLMKMNDKEGKSFPEIADWIEENL